MNAVTNYLRDSIEELKKVTWPTRKQTVRNTLIVITMSVVFAAFFAALDYGFRAAIQAII